MHQAVSAASPRDRWIHNDRLQYPEWVRKGYLKLGWGVLELVEKLLLDHMPLIFKE